MQLHEQVGGVLMTQTAVSSCCSSCSGTFAMAFGLVGMTHLSCPQMPGSYTPGSCFRISLIFLDRVWIIQLLDNCRMYGGRDRKQNLQLSLQLPYVAKCAFAQMTAHTGRNTCQDVVSPIVCTH